MHHRRARHEQRVLRRLLQRALHQRRRMRQLLYPHLHPNFPLLQGGQVCRLQVHPLPDVIALRSASGDLRPGPCGVMRPEQPEPGFSERAAASMLRPCRASSWRRHRCHFPPFVSGFVFSFLGGRLWNFM